jgi:N utilization substance protein A
MNVLLDDSPESGKTATVIVPDRQLSLAIGKEGQNARLAAKLTGWRIDIKSATEAAEETLGRLEDIKIAPEDMDLLTLAETLLRTQGGTGFSVEQREMVHAAVEDIEGLLASEGELGSGDQVPADAETETKAEPESEVEAEEGVGLGTPALEEEEPAFEAEPVLAAEAPAEEVSAPAFDRQEDEPFLGDEEEEEIPPFDGEMVSDSIGWVQVESQEDYYSGWTLEEDQEEDLEAVEFEWVRDETEEPEEEDRGKGKKKGKKRTRPGRAPEFEEGIDLTRGRKRGRPQGW